MSEKGIKTRYKISYREMMKNKRLAEFKPQMCKECAYDAGLEDGSYVEISLEECYDKEHGGGTHGSCK